MRAILVASGVGALVNARDSRVNAAVINSVLIVCYRPVGVTVIVRDERSLHARSEERFSHFI